MAPTLPQPVLHQRVLELAASLRVAGVSVSPAASIDAIRAVGHIDLLERAQLRAALFAVFVQSGQHRQSFDELFDLYFPGAQRQDGTEWSFSAGSTGEAADPADSAAPAAEQDTSEQLAEAIADGDHSKISALARRAVTEHAGVQAPDGVTTYYRYRLERIVNQDRLRDRLHEQVAGGGLAATLQREQIDEHLRRFDAEVDRQLAGHDAARRGRDRAAEQVARPVDQLDLLHLTDADQHRLAAEVDALARRLAAKLARGDRRRNRGVDLRRTMRRSLATGGVPFDVALKRPRERGTDLFVLCDVSSSVAAFVPFTLRFLQALTQHLGARATVSRRQLRSFVFVDTVAEVTATIGGSTGGTTAMPAELSASAGRSDYGRAFAHFSARFGGQVNARTTVLVLGDARNNHHAADTAPLAALTRQARAVYWLNPEPTAYWDRGDSLASEYAAVVTQMVEVRNLQQLADFGARGLGGFPLGSGQ